MFWSKKKRTQIAYDKNGKIPVIRSSICTGEQVAGFKAESTGKFEECMLIRDDSDYQEFLRLYDITEDQIKREW